MPADRGAVLDDGQAGRRRPGIPRKMSGAASSDAFRLPPGGDDPGAAGRLCPGHRDLSAGGGRGLGRKLVVANSTSGSKTEFVSQTHFVLRTGANIAGRPRATIDPRPRGPAAQVDLHAKEYHQAAQTASHGFSTGRPRRIILRRNPPFADGRGLSGAVRQYNRCSGERMIVPPELNRRP